MGLGSSTMTQADSVPAKFETITQLLGSACSRRTFSQEEGDVLEWALTQIAMDGSGPVTEVVSSYHSSLLAGADWHAAVSAGLLQTPREWGGEIRRALSSFELLRDEYAACDVEVFRFADGVITQNATQVPPLPGYVPVSAPKDLRPARLLELADELDVMGEGLELAKVFQDRFSYVLKRDYKLSFHGALAALFCDLGIESDKVPRLLSVAALVSIIFKPEDSPLF